MRAPLLAAVLALLLAGCATEPPAAGGPAPASGDASLCLQAPGAADDAWAARKPRVRFETDVGTFDAELDLERAPVTVGNFLDLTRSGFFDGTRFHRISPGFVIQGGDPLSKDDDARNDGTGGPGYDIPDEFHPGLRHDAAGVLSMANSGPNTGGSQFFVTLAATPHLDDRHSVFGRVVAGMDAVRAIGARQVGAEEQPLEPVTLTKVVEIDAVETNATTGADVHVVIPTKKAEPGRAVRFAVLAQNEGTTRDALAVQARPPEGWSCQTDAPVVVPAGTGRVLFLTLTPPAGATGTIEVPVSVASAKGATATTSLNVTIAPLGPEVKQGDKVTAHYAGLLPDGRLFDTSMEAVGTDPAQPKFQTLGGWRERGSYQTFEFTVGRNVIPGFTNLAKTAKVGETVTALIPAKDAYATGNVYERPLTGRDLVFELEIVRVG